MDGSLEALQKDAEFHRTFADRKPENKNHQPSYDLPSQPAGNLATQRLLRSETSESRLSISAPGDSDEREADRIAEQMIGSSSTEEPQHRDERPQAKRADSTGFEAAGSLQPVHAGLSTSGQPLDRDSRAFFEPRLGTDLQAVRVHTGREADAAARSLHARAFTLGSNVVFGQGQYQPRSESGRRLLGHELAHVVQQSGESSSAAHAARIQRSPDEKSAGEQTGAAGGTRDPGAFWARMTSHENYFDNNIREVNFFTAELAKIHYRDGSVLDLGLTSKWIKPPFQEVDYHTPKEGFRLFHNPKDRGSGYIREANLENLPGSTSFAEIQKRFYQPVNFYAHGESGRIVPSHVNALTAPVLCKILLDSERRYVEQTRFVAEFGVKVSGVIAGMGGGAWSKGPAGAVESGAARLAGRQAASAAMKKLSAEMEELLTVGGSRKIVVEGVEFLEVEVVREGTRLAIKRSKMTVLKELERGQGKGYNMVREFEDAAVDVAGFNGMKSVSIDVGFISNPGWREVLESMGYVRNASNDWVKVIKL
jgi:hypothetical protein